MPVYPLKFQLGPLEITGYGLMVMVGFLVGGWAMQVELRRRGLREDYAADIIVAAVIGGILGSKVYYAVLYRDLAALFSRGGMVWYGGLAGGFLAVVGISMWRRIPVRFTTELTAPALAVGYALGRVGCFLVQDDYGIPTSLPWGLRFPQGTPPSTAAYLNAQFGMDIPPGMSPGEVLPVHPTQLYEVGLMLLVFWFLWRLRRHEHAVGWLFGVYLVCAGLERFAIEFLRAKDDRFLGPLTLAQGLSIAIALVGLALMVARWRRDELSLAVPALKPSRALGTSAPT